MKRWVYRFHRQVGLFAMLAILGVAGTGWALMYADHWGGYDFRHMATGQGVILAGGTQGLFRSRDGGRMWEEVTMPIPTQHVTALAQHQGRFAVAFRDMGLWQSDDGFVWEKGPSPEQETILAVSSHGQGWAVLTDQALYEGGHRIPYVPAVSRRIHDWHTGWAGGIIGVRGVELAAVALIVLSLTGLLLAWPLRHRRRMSSIRLFQTSQEP